MNPVFLDTSGLTAVGNVDDQWHSVAERRWRELVASSAPIITTSLVMIELGDGLSKINRRPFAWQMRDRLLNSTRVEIIQTTSHHESRAWTLFRQTSDKEWGMTDCVSFVVAQDRLVQDVLSTDHHFEQAGFRLLLSSP
jgi:uncharacterized protein